MGYTSSTKTWGTDQLLWNALHLDDSALVLNDGNTKPLTLMTGGVYASSLPTYTNGDAAVMHFTADGKLMVDTELTIDGNVIIDNVAVWATDIADSTTTSFALVDATGHPQVDVLTLPGGLTGYAEDTAHTTGDIGVMPLAVRNDTLATLTTTDGDYAPLQVNAKGSMFVDVSSVLGSDMSVTNAMFSQITDGTTAVVVETAGTKKALNVNLTDGTNDMPTMDAAARAGFVQVSDGTNEADVIGTINSLKGDVSSVAGTATNVNGGNRDAGTQTTTLADDDPAVTSVQIMDDWDAVEDAAIGTDGAVIINKARSSQQAAVAEDDAVIPVTNLYGESINAGFDYSGNFNRVSEVDPVSSHHVEETLADVTNGADGTYYYYFDMDGYQYWATQATLNGGSGTATVTVEATIQDDGTAPASCTYVDVTNDLFGVASITASDILAADTPQAYKYVRIKVVAATGAADDADWTLYNKKMY